MLKSPTDRQTFNSISLWDYLPYYILYYTVLNLNAYICTRGQFIFISNIVRSYVYCLFFLYDSYSQVCILMSSPNCFVFVCLWLCAIGTGSLQHITCLDRVTWSSLSSDSLPGTPYYSVSLWTVFLDFYSCKSMLHLIIFLVAILVAINFPSIPHTRQYSVL